MKCLKWQQLTIFPGTPNKMYSMWYNEYKVWQPIEKWKKRIMNIWHDSIKNTGVGCRKCMLVWHHCKTITILKCSNSLPSSSSKSSTDGSKLPGEGKFPASSTYSFCGVNAMTMQIFELVHTRKLLIYPLANELQDWCMFLPREWQEEKYAFTSTNNLII